MRTRTRERGRVGGRRRNKKAPTSEENLDSQKRKAIVSRWLRRKREDTLTTFDRKKERMKRTKEGKRERKEERKKEGKKKGMTERKKERKTDKE